MINIENLIGKKFTRVTVIDKIDNTHWLCRCDCGKSDDFIETTSHLIHGYRKSCGCLKKKTSKINAQANRKYNKYDTSGEYGIGWTSNGNNEFYFDLEDYEKIKNYCWWSNRYVQTKVDKKTIMLHKLVMDAGNDVVVDHIDRNPMNCRKENLRICTQKDNVCNISKRKDNKSGVTGVCWSKKYSAWIAYIHKDKKQNLLGVFDDINDAIVARLKAEKEIFGEFAPQQHLYNQYKI